MTCITDFLNGDNVSASLQAALRTAAGTDLELFFPAGEYHFYPVGCSQKYCWFSNNDEGVKTIALRLENLDGFIVRGENARLIFHGRISPLCAFNCRNLTVEGLTIDFEDSFVSDADLVKRENAVAWFRFFGKHHVSNGKIVFTDDLYDNLSGRLLFYSYDRKKGENIWNVRPITIRNCNVLYRDGLVGDSTGSPVALTAEDFAGRNANAEKTTSAIASAETSGIFTDLLNLLVIKISFYYCFKIIRKLLRNRVIVNFFIAQ